MICQVNDSPEMSRLVLFFLLFFFTEKKKKKKKTELSSATNFALRYKGKTFNVFYPNIIVIIITYGSNSFLLERTHSHKGTKSRLKVYLSPYTFQSIQNL